MARARGPQSLVSLAVVAVLALAAAWVVRHAAEPGPAVRHFLEARPLEPAPARRAAEGEAGPAGALSGLAAPGLEPMGPAEVYGPDDLYVKINGKADLYLTSGFQRLATRRYALAGRPAAWLELFAYGMASPAGAFAVFSQQRRAGARPVEIQGAALAYATANSLYALAGRHYLELIGAEADQKLLAAMRRLAAAWAAGLAGETGLPPQLAWLPEERMVAGSRSLLRSGAFGFARLDEVYLARYRLAGGPAAAFASQRETPAAAEELAAAFAEFLLANGAAEQEPPAGAPPGARLFDLIGLYELVFTQGAVLAGVHEAASAADAAGLAARLAEKLPEPAP
jgi:hypothetical protein